MSYKYVAQKIKFLADTETPISIYLKIREHYNQCLLFENAADGLDHSQSSYIFFDPMAGISITGKNIETYINHNRASETAVSNDAVLPFLSKFIDQFSLAASDKNLPSFVGYINYDAVRYFETIDIATNATTPDIQFDLYRFLISINHSTQEMELIQLHEENAKAGNLQKITSILQSKNIPAYSFSATADEENFTSETDYLQQVEKGINHCQQGDCFQVVLSRSFERKFKGDDFKVYRALRSINPSPYLFYLDYNNFHLMGSSPEAQCKYANGKASLHPIAGTYMRTHDKKQDEEKAIALLNDEKEKAEHTMLVDLARNDLSKNFKNINIVAYKKIESYSHVIHLVSKIEGEGLLTEVDALQILADSFPAGTLSGAPKPKAMQIIKETETTNRGFYGGCVGFLGFDGSLNTAIMIRTILSKNNRLHYRAGAGITIASVPEKELEEINLKINALRKAIKMAEIL